jgi:hypothetical protein
MCGKEVIISNEHEHKHEKVQQERNIIAEQIDGTSYTFDTAECAMMFKRFSSVYGSNFADE